LRTKVISAAADHLIIEVPATLVSGIHDLVLIGPGFRVNVVAALNLNLNSTQIPGVPGCENTEPVVWTKRISQTQAKVYIKCPEIGARYQILAQYDNGDYTPRMNLIVASESDDRQRMGPSGRYLVRTVEINQRTRINITADGDLIRKVVYNN
jgi:hypothetical protein